MRQLWEEGALSTATGDSNSRQPAEASVSDRETRKTLFSKSDSNVVHDSQNPLNPSFSNLNSMF